jgi:hypothetical protein
MESYIIRVYSQDLDREIIFKNGIGKPCKYINADELLHDLKINGLRIIQYAFSTFGACYFFEVNGIYKGDIKNEIIDTKPSHFNWNV